MRPNFVIIGAQKAATTSLWVYLRHHPEVFMSPVKETNYFVAELGWRRGVEWYESLFAPAGARNAIAVGEASPNYTMYPGFSGVPERMAATIPGARLVYLLRHPVERMVSSYINQVTRGAETQPIERALLERPQYADTSRYAMQIDRFLEHFDRERLLVLLSEDLAAAPEETMERVLSFLGVRPDWMPPGLGARHHVSATKRAPRAWWRRLGGLMIRARIPEFSLPERVLDSPLTTRRVKPEEGRISDELRARLEDTLRPDVERLREYLGPEFDGWGLLS